MKATAIATPNIALVKYWGKRDEKLILPMQGSISVTMDKQLATKTTVEFSEKYKEDELWINDKKFTTPEEWVKGKPQLDLIRKMAGIDLKVKIVSYTVVPVAGGLAGSSAGLCSLALAATSALGLKLDQKDLSVICRRGSGSACRSVYGGFVEWRRGEILDGSDSHAVQIADENHWPEFRNVVALIEKGRKKVKSRAGMKQTVATSSLYPKRTQDLPKVLDITREAILKKDLPILLEAVMRESNNMHATMLDTWPPIFYLNDTSKKIIYAIHDFNADGIKAGYSFDAGPNPNIFTVEKHVSEIKKLLQEIEGVKEIFVCKPGSEPKLVEEHLF